ncbi:MAG: transketolase [Erysipelotrichia bacterium]|nr:transketolase [Erysipelotrichia bacterium]
MRTTFVELLLKHAKEDKNIQLVTGDLGFGVLKPFTDQFHLQYVNAGVAEQNMMAMAGGMASLGLRPIVYSIGNFPTLRCYEQIRNDVCYYDADVKIVCIGGGFTYGSLGFSHHATEDIAIMRALPNMHIFAPSDRLEANYVIEHMFNLKKPCYLRLERDSEKNLHKPGTSFSIGAPIMMNNFLKAKEAIFSYGTIAKNALEVANQLEFDSYSVPCLKPIDEKKFIEVLKQYKKVYTLEEHNVIGGLASIISELIAKHHLDLELRAFGINDILCSAVGDQEYLRKVNHLDIPSLLNEIKAKRK